MFSDLTCEEVSVGLDRVAEEVLCAAGVEGPPVDAIFVAHALGITVGWDDRQAGRARYVRLSGWRARAGRATILLRPEPRSERRQWAVAHEIGEHMAHRVFSVLGVDPRAVGPNERERVANCLAGRLLLPTVWFGREAATCGWELMALKGRYVTASHELIARRMLDFEPTVVLSIFDQGRLSFRQANGGWRISSPSRAEIQCWTESHETGRSTRMRQTGSLIQGWPIHEAGWRREILRLEVEAPDGCCDDPSGF